jgi:hypothetical protein
MSVAIAVWLKDLLPRTPGCVRSVAKRELLLAAREFYRDSDAWSEVVEATYFDVGDFEYVVLSSQPEAEVVRVISIEVNGSLLTAQTQRPLGDRGEGTPHSWFPTGPASVEIWPTPELYDDEVRIRVKLIPTVDAVNLPDIAQTRHYDGILDGVLGRLYSHPAKPYRNPTLAQYHLSRFRAAIGTAKGESIQGGFAGQNWVYPRFGK